MAHPDFSVNVVKETRAKKNIWTRVGSTWNTKNNKGIQVRLKQGIALTGDFMLLPWEAKDAPATSAARSRAISSTTADEIEAFVEGPRLVILGVDSEGPKAGDFGRRERPGERILQKTGPDPFSRPGAGDRKAREDHQGNRMPGDALAQPLRCILIVHVPERQRVEADNLVLRESQISLRAVGKLALQSEADQEAVQWFLAAIELLDLMITPQLLDAERHLFGRRLLEYAGFGQKPLEPRQGPGRRIERSQKRLPARRVESKMLTIGQCLPSAVERALQHELADRAPRSLRGGVQHPLRLRRQA
jgi:hypothetical protein